MRDAAVVVAGLAAAVVAVEMAVAHRYGYHRDELYFLACARRLAWGYVDQPPFTPAVARAAVALFGDSLTGLRLFPALAHGSVVVAAALTARELGGRRTAQVLAALAAATCTVFFGASHLLGTTTFDLAIWVWLTWLVARILRTGDQRLWPAAGALAGLGLLNKHSVVFLAAGVAVGVAAGRRWSTLRSPWPWAGAAVAVAMWLPNLWWQADHDWPVFDMLDSLRAEGREDGNLFLFVPLQLVLPNPFLAPLWLTGLWWLLRDDEARPFRPLGVAYVFLFLVFWLSSGKPYYLAGIYPMLLAAGAVMFERRCSARFRRRFAAAAVAGGLVGLMFTLPILPATVQGNGVFRELNPELAETYGWPQLVREVAAVYHGQPAGTVIFTTNYGQHGAIERFSERHRLPEPYSGHNNTWWWGPPPGGGGKVVVVGRAAVEEFEGCRVAATLLAGSDVDNDERGQPVAVCDAPASWAVAWPGLRRYAA